MKYTAILGLALAAVALANPMPTKKKGNSGNSGDAGDAGNASNAGTAGTAGNASGAAGAGSTASTAAGANPAAAQQVTASIDKWLQDIQAVNNFVDTAGSLQSAQEISAAASTAFVAAQDEGTQNDALQKLVQLDASGLSAAQDLQNQFKIIGPAINDTISNPQNVQKNIAAINGARCPPPAGNGAIFEEGAVQQSAAGVAGVQAALPRLPNACAALAQQALVKGANAVKVN